jgi:hypothetical protein
MSMDNQRFDDLARALAKGISRRRLLGGLFGGAVGALVTTGDSTNAACRTDGHRCQLGADCCSGFCRDYDPKTRHRNICATCQNDTVACQGACVPACADSQTMGEDCACGCAAGTIACGDGCALLCPAGQALDDACACACTATGRPPCGDSCCAEDESCVHGQCQTSGGVCPVASRCGSRQYCNDEQTCICIQTPDGDNRCGQLPSSCDVQTCETNADCANLGDGYFCDTPNSGCCTDPPAEQPRCIAPCGTVPSACPDARICGSNCCPEGEICCDGACASPTTDGSCPGSTGTCDHDAATADSLDAALTALANGAVDVAVTPAGCTRYRITRDGQTVTHEELVVNGQTAIVWDHTAAQSDGKEDLDLDGFFETRLTVTPAGAAAGWKLVIERFMPPSTTPVRREMYTRSGDTIHEVVEEDDGSGSLTTTSELDIPLTQWGSPDTVTNARMAMIPAAQTGSCTAADRQEILRLFRQAAAEGIACAEANGANSVKIGLEWQYMSRNLSTDLVITCEPLDGLIAWMDWTNWLGFDTGKAELHIDPDKFRNLLDPRNVDDPTYGQRRLLFHEFTHLLFGEHDQQLREMMGDEKYARWDQGESCARFCFSPKTFLDRCDCARCLNTNVCDPRCQPYKPCTEPTLGGVCTCHDTWYDDYTKCTVECPSGLFCFGHQCKKYTMECPP